MNEKVNKVLDAAEAWNRAHAGKKSTKAWMTLMDAAREAAAVTSVEMGNGADCQVAVGTCNSIPDRVPGLIYLQMTEPREFNQGCEDMFPIGKPAKPEDVLACVHFHSLASLNQTIELLELLRDDPFYAKGEAK